MVNDFHKLIQTYLVIIMKTTRERLLGVANLVKVTDILFKRCNIILYDQ